MKKIILISVLFFIFTACEHENIDYLPAVVYLKAPEIINKGGKEVTEFEVAVSDLNELEGTLEVKIQDESGKVLKKKLLDKLLFSTDGTLITFYTDKLEPSSKYTLTFKVCNIDNLCRSQKFNEIELNTAVISELIKIEGRVDNDKKDDLTIYFSLPENSIKTKEGKFNFETKAGEYDIYTAGKEFEGGFYRYIYLKSVNFDKNTKIYMFVPADRNLEYDSSLINCSFSSSGRDSGFMFFIFFLFAFLKAKRYKIKSEFK